MIQFLRGPQMPAHTSSGGRAAHYRGVLPDEIVMREVQRKCPPISSTFLEKPLLSRVTRRMGIRIVGFWRSIRLVEI